MSAYSGRKLSRPMAGVPIVRAVARATSGSIGTGVPAASASSCTWHERSIAMNHQAASPTEPPTVSRPWLRRITAFRPPRVDLRMDDETGRVDAAAARHDGAVGLHQQQVTDPHVSKVDAERVDPEAVEVLGVARGDVPAGAFVKAVPGEQPRRRGERPLAVQPLLL